VLLVEDNEMNRLVVRAMLKDYKLELTEVFNGEEAIKQLIVADYDVVLMDVQMPVMNGLDATLAIRNDLKLSIPIIALTANAIKGESDRCIAAGMNDFVSKPFEEENLVNTIARCIQRNTVSLSEKRNQEITSAHPLYSLATLERIGKGDQVFIRRMIGLFLDQVTKSVDNIEQAYKSGDLLTVKSLAHRIKPTISNMEIHSLEEVIRELEQMPEDQSTQIRIEKLVKIIKEVADQLQENLH
jgi:two-component system, sensor histidine kinase